MRGGEVRSGACSVIWICRRAGSAHASLRAIRTIVDTALAQLDGNFEAMRSNETNRSTTDDDARLYRKGGGPASRLCFIGNVLTENRNGLTVDAELIHAPGSAERRAALAMVEHLPAGDKTLGADKGYDTHCFIMELCELGITPHVAQNAYATETAKRCSAIDGRTTHHQSYTLSQKKRKRIEEIFG